MSNLIDPSQFTIRAVSHVSNGESHSEAECPGTGCAVASGPLAGIGARACPQCGKAGIGRAFGPSPDYLRCSNGHVFPKVAS